MTNRMLTRKEMQRRLTVETPYLKLFLGDMKIVIPTLVAVFLIFENPVSTFLGESLGGAWISISCFSLCRLRGMEIWAGRWSEWRTGYIMGYLEGFDLGTMEVSTF